MKSKLEVESVYGEGSTFSFVLEQKIVEIAPELNIASTRRLDYESSKDKTQKAELLNSLKTTNEAEKNEE